MICESQLVGSNTRHLKDDKEAQKQGRSPFIHETSKGMDAGSGTKNGAFLPESALSASATPNLLSSSCSYQSSLPSSFASSRLHSPSMARVEHGSGRGYKERNFEIFLHNLKC
eukprot:764294-Hanusia_phi.AAC.2